MTIRSFRAQIALDFGILLGGGALLAGILFYLASDISSRTAAIVALRQELSSRLTSIQSLAELRADSERAKPYSSVLENILPPKDALIHFPRDIEELARQRGVEFGAAFGAENAPTTAFPGFIGFTFTIGGTYAHVVDFFRAAESGRYILDWNVIDLNFREGVYRGTISGRVFYR